MLSATTLAALEAATPVEQRPQPPSDDTASVTPSDKSSPKSTAPSQPEPSTSDTIDHSIATPKDFSEHSEGHSKALDSVEKWVLAAVKKLGKKVSDLVVGDQFESNDTLASEILETVATWYVNNTTADKAGVIDHRPSELAKKPPQDNQLKVRGWIRRYINTQRATKRLPALPSKWGEELSGCGAMARLVNTTTTANKKASGKLYHHKHDMAPTQEQLTSMTYVGFSADQRVDADVLCSIEAGMAIGLYMPTGARGSELKKMHLQSLGHECIQDERSGFTFPMLKLTAFETKTKAQHLNQVLAHSNPHRCGIGLFGLSLLVRVKLYGPPPFMMQTNDLSWKIIGTNVDTIDRRLKDVFTVAGLRRQNGDPITYLGRHFGTRVLQHAGGSAEGGAARRGHSNGTASYHYTECPLPDLLKLAGNDSDKPFIAAHLSSELYPLADAVLSILFPQLDLEEKALQTRQQEVDAMRGNRDKVRTDEQLNDRERLLKALRFACRTALTCLIARPRTWKQWAIVEEELTVWQKATEPNHRVVTALFAGNRAAIEMMNQLAIAVRRHEDAEITARSASPDNTVSNVVVSAIRQMKEEQNTREEKMLQEMRTMLQPLMASVSPPPAPPHPEPPAEVPPPPPPPPAPIKGIKHKREAQDDVVYFSTWSDLGKALDYAKQTLVPLEKSEGAAWRILKREDGREDKSRDKQWRSYRSIAISVGLLIRDGKSYTEAVDSIQARFEGFGAKAHTPLLKAVNEEIKKIRDADSIAKEVMGY